MSAATEGTCKAGPGHQNTPTINIVDTSQNQEHKLVPTVTKGNNAGTEQAHAKMAEAMVTHAKRAVEAHTVDAANKLAKHSKAEQANIDNARKFHAEEIAKLQKERAKLNADLTSMIKKTATAKMPKAKHEAHQHHHTLVIAPQLPSMNYVGGCLSGLYGRPQAMHHIGHPYKCNFGHALPYNCCPYGVC